jgi:hypothetical protein
VWLCEKNIFLKTEVSLAAKTKSMDFGTAAFDREEAKRAKDAKKAN